MKKLMLLLFVFTLGFVFAAAAEDLGALAKKEKERREALEKQGKKAKTLTNADVANIKARLAIEKTEDESTQTPQDENATTTGQEVTEPPQPPQDNASESSAERAAQDQKLQELQSQRQELQQQVDQAKNTINQGGMFHTANVGNQYQNASEAQKKIEEVDKQIDEVKQKQAEAEQEDQDQPPQ